MRAINYHTAIMADLCKVFHFLRCVYSYLPELYGYCIVIVWLLYGANG